MLDRFVKMLFVGTDSLAPGQDLHSSAHDCDCLLGCVIGHESYTFCWSWVTIAVKIHNNAVQTKFAYFCESLSFIMLEGDIYLAFIFCCELA